MPAADGRPTDAWQALEPRALARTAANFTQTPLLKPAKYLRPGWDAEVFGCTLQEYVGTAQLVWVSAVKCAGRFDLALFDTPDGQLIARHLSQDTVTRVLDTHFATSNTQFRAANRTAEGRAGRDGDLRRYTYNPLPAGRTPVTVADAAEIEVLVTINDTPPGRLLLEPAADDVRFTWYLDTALYGHEHSLNPILDEAWNSYVWVSTGRADR